MNIDLRKLGQMTYCLLVCDENWKQSFMVIIEEKQFKTMLSNYLFREIEPDHYRFIGFF
jgi:hypothetical protein